MKRNQEAQRGVEPRYVTYGETQGGNQYGNQYVNDCSREFQASSAAKATARQRQMTSRRARVDMLPRTYGNESPNADEADTATPETPTLTSASFARILKHARSLFLATPLRQQMDRLVLGVRTHRRPTR